MSDDRRLRLDDDDEDDAPSRWKVSMLFLRLSACANDVAAKAIRRSTTPLGLCRATVLCDWRGAYILRQEQQVFG
jgi:hypothetical protein